MKEQESNAHPFGMTEALDGASVLVIGSTGFVGKVVLSMLLCRFPNVKTVFALVRPGMGNTAEERFYTKVAPSPAFDPLREKLGDGFIDFLREKVVPIPGDIGRPMCNFDEEQMTAFADTGPGGLDVIINSAGLVSFTPSLESAIRINAKGAQNVLDVARTTRAKLVHVSTCYVAGRRNGEVWEDEEVAGYYPRHEELPDSDFSAEAELVDCERMIEEVRRQARDRAHISLFRERARKSLLQERRDPKDPKTMNLAVARQRKIWTHQKLTEMGMKRSVHWGWTNTYTYTKSLGEQLLLQGCNKDSGNKVSVAIVRPAIVESAVQYPFAGWNEGFNTTAPLVYLMLKGHRQFVASDYPLDVIPVDFIASGILMVTAAILKGKHKTVYQLGTSDSNPVSARRLTELTGLCVRDHYKQKAKGEDGSFLDALRARLEGMPVSYDAFQSRSAPQWQRLTKRAEHLLDKWTPRWGAPRLVEMSERARSELKKIDSFSQRVVDLVDLFKPFTFDCNIVYRCDNIRSLYASLSPSEQPLVPWDPQGLDWREYWLGAHFEGLKKWVFPVLDDEFGPRKRSVYTYKDLVELFDVATELHRHRPAVTQRSPAGSEAPQAVYTYRQLRERMDMCASNLAGFGVVEGDRVALCSENRIEWPMIYFAILKLGAIAVPLDHQLTAKEAKNLVRQSQCKLFVVSYRVRKRWGADKSFVNTSGLGKGSEKPHAAAPNHLFDAAWFGCAMFLVSEVMASEQAIARSLPRISRKGDRVASILYTSGTTQKPKGVMLTHKNLTSMAAKLSSLFTLTRHDNLLSVLPLHHTFEFSAGLLMPLIHGSSITYLDEVAADSLSSALEDGGITGMVGVPALWQALHRKMLQRISDRGVIAEKVFSWMVDANRKLRESTPFGVHPGKVLFYPVHKKLGGRLRILISGGAALSPETMKAYRGMGFSLYEGYGMTEAAPVITVTRPGSFAPEGSVGKALPGVDIEIAQPTSGGVGEVVVKGPSVMKGYYDNEEATDQTLRDGWLHTGDLGRMDAEGNLFLVGRKKEMILGAAGENIYPDELEEHYGDCNSIEEISVVGIDMGNGETVAALIVPATPEGKDHSSVQKSIEEHMRRASNELPLYKRVKLYRITHRPLPKTSTRKVKRVEVAKELTRIVSLTKDMAKDTAKSAAGGTSGGSHWIVSLVARVCQRDEATIGLSTRLEFLGFDSLMYTELVLALENTGVVIEDPSAIGDMQTIQEVVMYVGAEKRNGAMNASSSLAGKGVPRKKRVLLDNTQTTLPGPVVSVGRRGLRFGQRVLYKNILKAKVYGAAQIPPMGGFIVCANHSSHLDMGLVKHALGNQGELLVALAAKDYFFDDPLRKIYFENFTNLVPMERYGSLKESLKIAGEVVRSGRILLIFPEGTRSSNGVMSDFKASLGYLAMVNRCGILPMYLAGAYDAMPKGQFLPTRKPVSVHIAPFLDPVAMTIALGNTKKSQAYRRLSAGVETIVRRKAPEAFAWTLGKDRRAAAEDKDGAVADALLGLGDIAEPSKDGVQRRSEL